MPSKLPEDLQSLRKHYFNDHYIAFSADNDVHSTVTRYSIVLIRLCLLMEIVEELLKFLAKIRLKMFDFSKLHLE